MKGKILFNKSGSGSLMGRVTIPKAFLEVWGASKENNKVDITMENGCVVIAKEGFWERGEQCSYEHINHRLDEKVNFAEIILAKAPLEMKLYIICNELEKQGIRLFQDYVKQIEEEDLIYVLLCAYRKWRGEKTEERFLKACQFLNWDDLSEKDWDRLRMMSNEMVIDFLR